MICGVLFIATVVATIVATGAGCGASSSSGDDAGIGDAPPPSACHHAPLALGAATLAGCALSGTTDGAREDARFANPVNVAIGPDGKVYVADFDNNRLRV